MVALAKAGMGTSDNSRHSAAVITVVPSSIWYESITSTPTDTESKTPSLASCRASSPAAVAAIFAVNSMPEPSAASRRSVTNPTGWEASWYMNSFGALPSTGRLPGANMTDSPPDTVADTW